MGDTGLTILHRSNGPKTHGIISQIMSQVMKGKRISPKAAVNLLATPSRRFTLVDRAADRAVLQQLRLRGERMFRRGFLFAPPEVYKQQYQLGPKQTRNYLLH